MQKILHGNLDVLKTGTGVAIKRGCAPSYADQFKKTKVVSTFEMRGNGAD